MTRKCLKGIKMSLLIRSRPRVDLSRRRRMALVNIKSISKRKSNCLRNRTSTGLPLVWRGTSPEGKKMSTPKVSNISLPSLSMTIYHDKIVLAIFQDQAVSEPSGRDTSISKSELKRLFLRLKKLEVVKAKKGLSISKIKVISKQRVLSWCNFPTSLRLLQCQSLPWESGKSSRPRRVIASTQWSTTRDRSQNHSSTHKLTRRY